MTSYSTYAVDTIRFVDGGLSTEDETRDEQRYMLVEALTSGAVRALLDTTRDEANPEAEVSATEWHGPNEGWEIEALTDASQVKLRALVESFLDENLLQVLDLVDRIAWEGRWDSEIWHGSRGMAVYRVGMLLGYQLHGDGIGFSDYYSPVTAMGRDSVTDRLRDWVKAHADYDIEDSWIDSTEEPCLLHLGR